MPLELEGKEDEVFMIHARKTKKSGERGSAFIELGLLFPALLLILLGGIDFARVFYASTTLINAAEVGALYGAQSVAKSDDTSGMQTAATNDGKDLRGITATATKYCQCGNGTTQPCPLTCAVGTAKTYVKVQTNYTFNTYAPIPGIPSSVALTRSAVIRVQ